MQSMKAPYLILCSEEDDLAPYQTIFNFAQRLEDLGGDVKLIKWNGSPHVGMFLSFCILYVWTLLFSMGVCVRSHVG